MKTTKYLEENGYEVTYLPVELKKLEKILPDYRQLLQKKLMKLKTVCERRIPRGKKS